MYQINDTFDVELPMFGVSGKVRVVASSIRDGVALVRIDSHVAQSPKTVPYDHWVTALEDSTGLSVAHRCEDPFLHRNWSVAHAPSAARTRLKSAETAILPFAENKLLLLSPVAIARVISEQATALAISRKTVRRWIYIWLQAGFETRAVIQKFSGASRGNRTQTRGAKRGRHGNPEFNNRIPIHEIRAQLEAGLERFYFQEKLPLRDALPKILQSEFGVPKEMASPDAEEKLFLSADLIRKFKIPSRAQINRILTQMKAAKGAESKKQRSEASKGNRGTVSSDIDGPGYYEIDGTYLQYQLTSRITKKELAGRPLVYLVIDLFAFLIVGYAFTLENPSWAIASLALLNAFSDKGPIFKRLKLPYESKDWPCHHLPSYLTADRAELVSNMGQEFARSLTTVRITPSMCPIAKGSVEGGNSQLKHALESLDLAGAYEKIRQRRATDGKAEAALDFDNAEAILVETIMELNRRAILSHRIPHDAIATGVTSMTRTQLFEWGLIYRPGHTRAVSENFAYEHLLSRGTATMKGPGLYFEGQYFMGDRIYQLDWIGIACSKEFTVEISYHPLSAAKIYFLDPIDASWHPANNIDTNAHQFQWSFTELRQMRAINRQIQAQTDFEQAGKNEEGRARRLQTNAAEKKEMQRQTKDTVRSKNAQSIRLARRRDQVQTRANALESVVPTKTEATSTSLPSVEIVRPAQSRSDVFPWDELPEADF